MFASAARRMGYHVAVWDPDASAPAHRLATHSFSQPFTDQATLDSFSRLASVATYEWENVPVTLCERLEARTPLRPSSAILKIIQDRLVQKNYLSAQGFPVPAYAPVLSPSGLQDAVGQIGAPAICKTCTAGYDGKGQWKILQLTDVSAIEPALRKMDREGVSWIVENMIPFERELSILIARDSHGQSVRYPVAQNEHVDGILRTTIVPADIPPAIASRAADLATEVIDRLNGVGMFCIELFQMANGELLINEIAPRPHNSGHYTLEACTVSQFEQQVRALCNLPLGEVRLLSVAAMVNLIGQDVTSTTTSNGCVAVMTIPGAVLHLYGKQEVRPQRKMGHVTILADDAETVRKRVHRLYDVLSSQSVR